MNKTYYTIFKSDAQGGNPPRNEVGDTLTDADVAEHGFTNPRMLVEMMKSNFGHIFVRVERIGDDQWRISGMTDDETGIAALLDYNRIAARAVLPMVSDHVSPTFKAWLEAAGTPDDETMTRDDRDACIATTRAFHNDYAGRIIADPVGAARGGIPVEQYAAQALLQAASIDEPAYATWWLTQAVINALTDRDGSDQDILRLRTCSSSGHGRLLASIVDDYMGYTGPTDDGDGVLYAATPVMPARRGCKAFRIVLRDWDERWVIHFERFHPDGSHAGYDGGDYENTVYADALEAFTERARDYGFLGTKKRERRESDDA